MNTLELSYKEQKEKEARALKMCEFIRDIKMDDFKRCVTWYKSFDSWTGTISLPEIGTHSVRGVPGRAVRFAKPEILDQLFDDVCNFCLDRNIDLPAVIKSAVKAKKAKAK